MLLHLRTHLAPLVLIHGPQVLGRQLQGLQRLGRETSTVEETDQRSMGKPWENGGLASEK